MERPYPANTAKRYTCYGLILGILITASALGTLPALRPLTDASLFAVAFLIVPPLSAAGVAYNLPLIQAYKNRRGLVLSALLAIDTAVLLTLPFKAHPLFRGNSGDLILLQTALAIGLANSILTGLIALPSQDHKQHISPTAHANARLLGWGTALGAIAALPLIASLPPIRDIASSSHYGALLFLLLIPVFNATSNAILNEKIHYQKNRSGLLQISGYSLISAALCGLLTAHHVPALLTRSGILTLLIMTIAYGLSSGLLAAWLSLPAADKKT